MKVDYYQSLGVLPSAEEVVIRAAYKALAQKYHPDRNPAADAALKMQEVNRAFEILNNPASRSQYDKERNHKLREEPISSTFEEHEEAFSDAILSFEEKWQIALTVYPEIAERRQQLQKISKKLAFAFTILLLETKRFKDFIAVADNLEKEFLKTYFGNNSKIIDYARELILNGEREAAMELNTLISVLGSNSDAQRIITAIESKFEVAERISIRDFVRYSNDPGHAIALCKLMGLQVSTVRRGFFKENLYKINGPNLYKEIESPFELIRWVREKYC